MLFTDELQMTVCHCSLIVTQFCDRYIQVKDNEIVDSGSLQGDRYMQVNLTENKG